MMPSVSSHAIRHRIPSLQSADEDYLPVVHTGADPQLCPCIPGHTHHFWGNFTSLLSIYMYNIVKVSNCYYLLFSGSDSHKKQSRPQATPDWMAQWPIWPSHSPIPYPLSKKKLPICEPNGPSGLHDWVQLYSLGEKTTFLLKPPQQESTMI
jgi:hypothetical protein